MKNKKVTTKAFTYKVSPSTVRKANQRLIRNGISDNAKNSYNGDIIVKYALKDGVRIKTFSNNDIKTAFEKALNVYAERV